ncbi:acetate/propionate family kinase [Tsukamurella asaccharolytica]|uniref:Acetate kinase n=1 Tax=Tsukamurella asaccharolytica TaxID=2592067 RepID=A0A5C5RFE0_9ACTN|nr:acetate/propionate family kinase [Tsukamurella asaccharolytica]TWS21372.1 acetate/propionate family kinase [Tsukamurella asaccharolytica]
MNSHPGSRVLVINCGSSSLKYQLLEPDSGSVLASGLVEQIGEASGRALHRQNGEASEFVGEIVDHAQGMRLMTEGFAAANFPLDEAGIAAFAHRFAHGGTTFSHPAIVTDEVEAQLEALEPLAPLHNHVMLRGIRIARAMFPDIPHVAVFDTEYWSHLPAAVSTIPIDADVAREHGIRKYGFHGFSHQFVSAEAAAFLGRPPDEVNLINLHLGSGSSVAAIRGGEPADVSLGMSTNSGVVMGTRTGELDPGVIFALHQLAGLDLDAIEELLFRRSGLKGLCGDNDFRAISERMAAGDEAARLAYDVFVLSLRRYLGAYLVMLPSIDAIVFTGGIGENASTIRADTVAGLERFGIRLDPARNGSSSRESRRISSADSDVEIVVIPTNEELGMARAAWEFV